MKNQVNEPNDSSFSDHLIKMAQRLLAETEVNHVLNVAMDEVIQISGAERGMIILFDTTGDILFETARNLEKQDINRPEFEISHTIINKVKKEQKPICLRNALQEPSLKDSASVSRLNILSVICLPLLHKSELFGVVYLDNRTVRGAFLPETFQFVERFTDFISVAAFSALERKQLVNHITALETELRNKYHFDAIIGNDLKIVDILKLVGQIAATDATVLIQGESGTGKELIARALHYNSQRKDNLFVPINCGALPENLLESELFGHVHGAFTGAIKDKVGLLEQADGGTLFLDEISEMSPVLQVKLLRVLQDGQYYRLGSTPTRQCDVRVISATNRELEIMVKQSSFREDLFYRLNVVDVKLPPLRKRRNDIILLIKHFLSTYGVKYNKKDLLLSLEAETLLLSYDFPGNVRELENIIHRAVVLAESQVIEVQQLPSNLQIQAANFSDKQKTSIFAMAKQQLIEKFERDYVIDCLKSTKGNITRAANVAGMDKKNLYSKMKKYSIKAITYK